MRDYSRDVAEVIILHNLLCLIEGAPRSAGLSGKLRLAGLNLEKREFLEWFEAAINIFLRQDHAILIVSSYFQSY